MCVLYVFSLYYSYSRFVIARRYASAVFAVTVCPSVCSSQGNPITQKIRVLPSGTLSQALDFENFAILQVYRVVNKTRCRRGWWSLLTTPTTSRGCLLQVSSVIF